MQKVTPFLWFERDAFGVVKHYQQIFGEEHVSVQSQESFDNPPPGDVVQIVTMNLFGVSFRLMSAGKHDAFNDAISFEVICEDQEEIDRYWNALTADGGKEMPCGWCADKYGVRWQITPKNFKELVSSPAAMQKMFTMTKLVIADLENAV